MLASGFFLHQTFNEIDFVFEKKEILLQKF